MSKIDKRPTDLEWARPLVEEVLADIYDQHNKVAQALKSYLDTGDRRFLKYGTMSVFNLFVDTFTRGQGGSWKCENHPNGYWPASHVWELSRKWSEAHAPKVEPRPSLFAPASTVPFKQRELTSEEQERALDYEESYRLSYVVGQRRDQIVAEEGIKSAPWTNEEAKALWSRAVHALIQEGLVLRPGALKHLVGS